MIIHALIQFNVPITIDIDKSLSKEEVRDLLLTESIKDVLSKEPRIVKCNERPDIVNK